MKYTLIKTLAQYNDYCRRHEQLSLNENESDMDEVELLELLIDEYDRRILKDKYEKLNPVELLRTLLCNNKQSQAMLASELGISRQLINDILGYRRNISKGLVKRLAAYFSMNEEAFSREYDLRKDKSKPTGVPGPR